MPRLFEITASRLRLARHETVIASEAKQSHAAGAPLLRLVLVGLGVSVVPLDTSVNIAFPDITGSFGLPIAMIQWVVICYVLTHAGLMLALGRAGDIWGHGRVFRAGLSWSVAAFILCAAAPSFGWLLFFRFLQGIGAGLIISCAPALVTGLYSEARRSHALGIFTLMFAIGSALGPLIGGALVAEFGWPAVFWFRAPIALTSLIFLRGLPRAVGSRERQFDTVGALLLAVGLVSMLLAINALPRLGNGEYLALVLAPAAVLSLGIFVWWESRIAQPVVEIGLFRDLGFAVVNLAFTVLNLVAFSIMLIAPYFLVPRLGLLRGGVVLASGFIAMAAASPLAGWLVPRLGPARSAPSGAVLIGLGLFLVGGWQPDTGLAVMLLPLGLHGLGMALFQVSYMEVVMAASPLAHRGVAGSLSMLTRTIGTVTGAALLTLGFQAIQAGARAAGSDPADAFLAAFHMMFRIAGITAIVVGAVVAWSSRRGDRGGRRPGL